MRITNNIYLAPPFHEHPDFYDAEIVVQCEHKHVVKDPETEEQFCQDCCEELTEQN